MLAVLEVGRGRSELCCFRILWWGSIVKSKLSESLLPVLKNWQYIRPWCGSPSPEQQNVFRCNSVYKWDVGLNCLLSCFKKNTQIPEILKITDDLLLSLSVLRFSGAPVYRSSKGCSSVGSFRLREESPLVFVECGLLLPSIWWEISWWDGCRFHQDVGWWSVPLVGKGSSGPHSDGRELRKQLQGFGGQNLICWCRLHNW